MYAAYYYLQNLYTPHVHLNLYIHICMYVYGDGFLLFSIYFDCALSFLLFSIDPMPIALQHTPSVLCTYIYMIAWMPPKC